MASNEEDEKLLAEVKKALKSDTPNLAKQKEAAKALGDRLPKNKS